MIPWETLVNTYKHRPIDYFAREVLQGRWHHMYFLDEKDTVVYRYLMVQEVGSLPCQVTPASLSKPPA